ncbi:MAG: Holliday junction branch migration protein RuvA [Alphaproteobacteria bacterium]
MIARLKGLLAESGAGFAVIDCGGVGYLVFCSVRTLSRMPSRGEAIQLHVETHVREDHIHLYGFSEVAEKDWFRLLTTVQGVGAKVALAILSVLSPDEILQAIAAQDKALMTRADGVGPKLAARIVAELKDKAGAVAIGAPIGVSNRDAANESGKAPLQDTVSALVNLGYGRSEAFGAASKAVSKLGDTATVDILIKAALRELAA